MEERDACPNRSPTQGIVLECKPKELTIKCEGKLPFLHIEKDAQDSLFLEGFAVLAALGVASVPQLAEAVKPEAEIVVAEGVAHAELLLRGHSYFKLVLCARVRYDLPVVLSVHKGSI